MSCNAIFKAYDIFLFADKSEILNASCFQFKAGSRIIHCSWDFVPPPRDVWVSIYFKGQVMGLRVVFWSRIFMNAFDIPFDV